MFVDLTPLIPCTIFVPFGLRRQAESSNHAFRVLHGCLQADHKIDMKEVATTNKSHRGGSAHASSFCSNKPPLEYIYIGKRAFVFAGQLLSTFFLPPPARPSPSSSRDQARSFASRKLLSIHVGRPSDPQRTAKRPLSSSSSLRDRKLCGGG